VRRCGFTLIELVFVALVLAVLLVVALPGFQRTSQRLRTEQAAFELAQLARAAREQAIARGAIVEWVWDREERLARLQVLDDEGVTTPLEDRLSRSSTLPSTLTLELQQDGADATSIFFFPDGTSQATQVFVRTPGPVYTVTVDASTSQASVSAGEPEGSAPR
jgi:prepilin-type N-terminal cleavage/methylation domain-containing protein